MGQEGTEDMEERVVTLGGFARARLGQKSKSLRLTMTVMMTGGWVTFTESLIHIRPYFESFTVFTNFILTRPFEKMITALISQMWKRKQGRGDPGPG